jgi:hypothetical protein
MPIDQITSASLASGVPTRAQLPAGSVLQVVQAISGTISTTSTSYVDATGASVSITPSSAANKILILVSGSANTTSAVVEGRGYWRLQRASTTLLNDQVIGYYFSPDITSDGNIYVSINANYLDSPNTTSATTYKLGFAAGASVLMNGTNWTVTALEIAA